MLVSPYRDRRLQSNIRNHEHLWSRYALRALDQRIHLYPAGSTITSNKVGLRESTADCTARSHSSLFVILANDSAYGLSGGVFSATEERAERVARRIRTGSIGINGGVWYGADSPYGGYKSSGIGRQCGIEGFEQHLETKAVAYPL